ncbi:MAG: hypothetical protein AAFY56_12075 [Pseudomonadota bacterium]
MASKILPPSYQPPSQKTSDVDSQQSGSLRSRNWSMEARRSSDHIPNIGQPHDPLAAFVPRPQNNRQQPANHAPAPLRPTDIQVPQFTKNKSNTVWAGIAAGFVTGAAGGATYGAVGGLIAGSIALPVIGTVAGTIVGGVAGGLIGGIGGAVVGGLSALAAGVKKANRQERHFNQAMASLEAKGVTFTPAERNRLQSLSPKEWRELLQVSRNKVGDKADRQRIREAVVLEFAKSTDPDPKAAALRYKDQLKTAANQHTLHLKADFHEAKELGGDKFDQWLDKYDHVFSTKEFWDTQDPQAHDRGDGFLVQLTADTLFGGRLAINALKRVCADNYQVTAQDQWQINQSLMPNETDPRFIHKEVDGVEVGARLNTRRKHELLDKVFNKYNDVSNGWNTDDTFRNNFRNAYASANSIDGKIAVLEQYQKDAMQYIRSNAQRTQIPRIMDHVNLSRLPRRQTLPRNLPQQPNAPRAQPQNQSGVGHVLYHGNNNQGGGNQGGGNSANIRSYAKRDSNIAKPQTNQIKQNKIIEEQEDDVEDEEVAAGQQLLGGHQLSGGQPLQRRQGQCQTYSRKAYTPP